MCVVNYIFSKLQIYDQLQAMFFWTVMFSQMLHKVCKKISNKQILG